MRTGGRVLACGVLLAIAAAPGSTNRCAEAQQSVPPSDTAVRILRDLPAGRTLPARSSVPNPPQFLLQPVAGPNLLVNDPAEDVPDRTTENETTIAVLGSTVCVGYNDTGVGRFPNPGAGFSRSDDAGLTWTDEGPAAAQLLGDPVLAVHKASGAFYYAQLALMGGYGEMQGFVSSIAVQRSVDGCHTFLPAVNANPFAAAPALCSSPQSRQCSMCRRNADCDSGPGTNDGICIGPDIEDKPWMAVDNSGGPHDGTLYLCWTHFANEFSSTARSAAVLFTQSNDGGLTFAAPQVLSAPSETFPTGCHVNVWPNGEVYVAWSGRSPQYPIMFRRSLDGGFTWDAPVQVNGLAIREAGTDRVAVCGSTSMCGTTQASHLHTLNGDIRMAAQAWMAVDTTDGPYRGNVYLSWASDPPGAIDNSDVYFSRSVDGGVTWTPEVQVGGGTATDQFEPFVEVGGNGTLTMAWYDRRNDPAHNALIDVYATFSRDGGATLDPITRLTDVSFPVPPLSRQMTASGNFDPGTSACYMGEYIGVAADAENFYYAWGDNRDTVVSSHFPRGRADPDVFLTTVVVPPLSLCVGDCDGDGRVTVSELVKMVGIALGTQPASTCVSGDANRDGQITVSEVLFAVQNALNNCLRN